MARTRILESDRRKIRRKEVLKQDSVLTGIFPEGEVYISSGRHQGKTISELFTSNPEEYARLRTLKLNNPGVILIQRVMRYELRETLVKRPEPRKFGGLFPI